MGSELATLNPAHTLLMRLFTANQNIETADKALKRAKENKKAALMVRERIDQEVASYAEGGQPELDINVTKTAKPAKKPAKTAKKRKPAKNRPALKP